MDQGDVIKGKISREEIADLAAFCLTVRAGGSRGCKGAGRPRCVSCGRRSRWWEAR